MVTTKAKAPLAFAWLEQALTEIPPGERISATGVPWAVYLRLSNRRDDSGSRVRITFDRGNIELMSPKFRHEKPSHRLGLLIHSLAKTFGCKLASARSTTLQEEQAEQGLEPDNCFYIANAPAILTVEDIDLTIHPPPDLAIEVDVSRSSVPKEPIYATMGVPELWRHDKGTVIIRLLSQEGTYVTSSTSRSFPKVTAEDLKALLDQTAVLDDIDAEEHFRAWAKTLIPPAANP